MTKPAQIRQIALPFVLTLLLTAPLARAADPAPAKSGDGAAKIVTTASGLQYVDTKVGTGATPKNGQTASVKYEIFDGEKHIERSSPAQPFEFILGREQAMKAIEEGVSTMKVGGTRTLIVPPALGYGTQGVPGKIPANATLRIELELLAVK